jgi:hypothetical protein
MEEDGFEDFGALLRCGVYALLLRGRVVYVGQSKLPLVRVYQHAVARGKKRKEWRGKPVYSTGFQFDGIWFRSCMLREVDEIEQAMIKKYQPKHNTQYKLAKPPIPIEELMRLLPARDNVQMAAATPRPSVYRRF